MLGRVCTFMMLGLACMAQAPEQVTPGSAPTPLPETGKKIPGLEWMPPGSKLKNVSLPRYKGRELNLLMTSSLMTVMSPHEIAGDQVFIYLFDPGKVKTGTMWMRDASYFLDTKILVSHGETHVDEPRFDIKGTGMVYDTTLRRGFIKGPVITRIQTEQFNKKKSKP